MDISFDIQDVWQEYDMDSLKESLGTLFPRFSISLEELFEQVLAGDLLGAMAGLMQGVTDGLGAQFSGMKNILVWLLVLGIVSSLTGYFADIFDKHQVSDLGFYVMYLLMSAVLLNCFEQAADTAVQAMENVVLFIKLLVPTYLLAVGVATGTTTVGASYQLILLLIYGVENILVAGVIPLVYSYCMLAIVNGIWIEQKLTMCMDLLAKAIRAILKVSVGAVTGVSVFQSVVTPVIDSVKASAVQKAISAIPGVGNAAEGVVELVTGTAVIIKNSMGVVLLILLLVLCAGPMIKMCLIACLLKTAAALMGIVSDKRLSACTDKVGEGSMLLLRTAGTAMLLFLITISVVATATNRGF
ncbi:MAG: stage III sporulation protein AE [Lachnospiraceae bacterium]|nr:stage III sporulation protein AE [Lachnospiraceae bacterium]